MEAKCPKCDGTEFKKLENKNENEDYEFIICKGCSCIVGCLDKRIEWIEDELRDMDKTLYYIKNQR